MKVTMMVPIDVDVKIVDVSTREKNYKEIRKRQKPRVYVWEKNESVMQNLVNRRQRPVELYKQFALQALQFITADKHPYKLKWSQYAGCSCPCSPGFIVEDLPASYDVHVTIQIDAVKEEA